MSHYRDKYFLFSALPLAGDLYNRLPLKIADGVYLEKTPTLALHNAAGSNASREENIATTELVYPGLHLNVPINHTCIKIDSTIPDNLKEKAFWYTISALYIAQPYYMQITGSFYYGDSENGFVRNPASLDYRTNISIDALNRVNNTDIQVPPLQYNEQDIERALQLNNRIWKIFENQYDHRRPFTCLNNFLQATLWEKLNFASSIFTKLFTCIDAFTGNPSHHHSITIQKRIHPFLNKFEFGNTSLNIKLQRIWDTHRHAEFHGYHKGLVPGIHGIDPQELRDLFQLMDGCRLSLFKMLLLDDEEFVNYCSIPLVDNSLSTKEQNKLASLRNDAADKFFGIIKNS